MHATFSRSAAATVYPACSGNLGLAGGLACRTRARPLAPGIYVSAIRLQVTLGRHACEHFLPVPTEFRWCSAVIEMLFSLWQQVRAQYGGLSLSHESARWVFQGSYVPPGSEWHTVDSRTACHRCAILRPQYAAHTSHKCADFAHSRRPRP